MRRGHTGITGNPTMEDTYFFIEPLEYTIYVGLVQTINGPTISLQYSSNLTDWIPITSSAGSSVGFDAHPGVRYYFKGSVSCFGLDTNKWTYFVGDGGPWKVGGNVLSLFYGDDFRGKDRFPTISSGYHCCGFLRESPTLVDASDLVFPIATLEKASMMFMFQYDTALKYPPKIFPATTLSPSCYKYTYYGCTALEKCTKLPANTLVNYCYQYMYYGCSNLKELHTLMTSKTSNSMGSWAYGVSSVGTFYKNATTSTSTIGSGVGGIPTNWTVVNV